MNKFREAGGEVVTAVPGDGCGGDGAFQSCISCVIMEIINNWGLNVFWKQKLVAEITGCPASDLFFLGI